MSRFLGMAVLGVCLATSVAVISVQSSYAAQSDMQKHVWTDQEDPHWHEYLKEKRKKDHDWAKATKREQRDYWKWRDAHPDAH